MSFAITREDLLTQEFQILIYRETDTTPSPSITYEYYCISKAGTPTDKAAWRIKRVAKGADNDELIEASQGTAVRFPTPNFDAEGNLLGDPTGFAYVATDLATVKAYFN